MSRPLAIITEELDPEPEAWLAEHCEVLRARIDPAKPPHPRLREAAALIVRTYTRVDAALLDRAPALRVIARAGVGLDNIDLDACRSRGIAVVHTPEANTRAVVEYLLALILDELRPRAPLLHAPDAREWATLRRTLVGERELSELSIGIYGFGKIGSRIGRALAALDATVRYCDLREISLADRHGCLPVPANELLATSDILTIHVDGRRANRNLIDAAALARCRAEVRIFNTSRGFVIDPAALADFLRTRPRARAILDVHEPEPFNGDYPLLGLPNARLLPHLASGTRTAKLAMSWVVRDVVRVLRGASPEFPAAPEPA